MTSETKQIVTVALLLFTACAWFWPFAMAIQIEQEQQKKRGDPPPYDERQRIARMRAGSHALYVLIGFLIAWTTADQFDWFPWAHSMLDMTLCGIILAYTVWSAECVLHDAIASWKDKRPDFEFLPLVHGGLMLIWLEPAGNVQYCDSWMPFIFWSISMVLLIGVAVYKIRKRKKAEAEDVP